MQTGYFLFTIYRLYNSCLYITPKSYLRSIMEY
nr:MAG TPA: hypothetical protein [Herelleviridae sp.]